MIRGYCIGGGVGRLLSRIADCWTIADLAVPAAKLGSGYAYAGQSGLSTDRFPSVLRQREDFLYGAQFDAQEAYAMGLSIASWRGPSLKAM